MNYTELYNTIQSYTENQFPAVYLASASTVSTTTQINTFITQAEQRIYNSVQFPSLRKNVTGATTTSNKYLSCPSDFIRQAYPQPTDTAIPKYYALFGPTVASSVITNELSFILGPTPDTVYSVELHYYYYPESITTVTSGQTWLGDNFDTVLLYGSLVEAYIFMKGEVDIITMYETKYKEALAVAQRLGDGLERSDAYRSGQYRQSPLPQNSGVR